MSWCNDGDACKSSTEQAAAVRKGNNVSRSQQVNPYFPYLIVVSISSLRHVRNATSSSPAERLASRPSARIAVISSLLPILSQPQTARRISRDPPVVPFKQFTAYQVSLSLSACVSQATPASGTGSEIHLLYPVLLALLRYWRSFLSADFWVERIVASAN